jgi:hypothetical protein
MPPISSLKYIMASLLNPKTFLFIYIKWFSLLYSNSRLISMIIILTCYHSKMQCILWKKLTLFLQNNITLQLNCTFVKGSQIWREKHPIKSLYIFLLTSLKSVYKLLHGDNGISTPHCHYCILLQPFLSPHELESDQDRKTKLSTLTLYDYLTLPNISVALVQHKERTTPLWLSLVRLTQRVPASIRQQANIQLYFTTYKQTNK